MNEVKIATQRHKSHTVPWSASGGVTNAGPIHRGGSVGTGSAPQYEVVISMLRRTVTVRLATAYIVIHGIERASDTLGDTKTLGSFRQQVESTLRCALEAREIAHHSLAHAVRDALLLSIPIPLRRSSVLAVSATRVQVTSG